MDGAFFSDWKSITIGVLSGLVPRPLLFVPKMNDLDENVGGLHTKFCRQHKNWWRSRQMKLNRDTAGYRIIGCTAGSWNLLCKSNMYGKWQ